MKPFDEALATWTPADGGARCVEVCCVEVIFEPLLFGQWHVGVYQNGELVADKVPVFPGGSEAARIAAERVPTVPVIPEGWRLRHVIPAGDQFCAVLDFALWGDHKAISRLDDNPITALTAAIEAAKDGA